MQNITSIFHKAIKNNIGDRFSKYVLDVLSNMLALDFSLRKIQVDAESYAHKCTGNILNYLGDSSLLSNEFNDVLTIFSIAIADIKDSNESNKNQRLSLENEMIEKIFQNCPQLGSLKQNDKGIVRDLLVNLYLRDPNINFNVLLNNTNVLSKSLQDIHANLSKEQALSNILAFLKLQAKEVKSSGQTRWLAK